MTRTEISQAAAGFAERDLTVHESRVRVLAAGSGEPLLCLHDPGDTLATRISRIGSMRIGVR